MIRIHILDLIYCQQISIRIFYPLTQHIINKIYVALTIV